MNLQRPIITVIICILFAATAIAKTAPAAKPGVWDIQRTPRGWMMYLDVPYIGHADTVEYLTLNVSKEAGSSRPAFISVMVQSPVDQKKAMFLTYSKNGGTVGHLEPQKELTTKLDYLDCNTDFCTVRIMEGYAKRGDKKERVDIFSEFLKYEHVMFLFFYPDGTHKSVAIPLASFKKQWKKLK